MNLNAELRAFYRERRAQMPADMREISDRFANELAESGLADRALGVGAQAPRFSLPSASGRLVALDDLLAHGHVVLSFYRGAWCPYCNLELRALQRHQPELTTRGARLVAVSPQIPDEAQAVADAHELTFDVLSDVGSDVAKQYGLAFDIPADLAATYDARGFELGRVNGGHARTLPIPATYVIDGTGEIRWAFVDSDYTTRAEPADILAAIPG